MNYASESSNSNISANYYPVNSIICMEDVFSDRQFSIINDRSQGGSALKPGTIDLVQNRESPVDDNKGLNEPLQERDEFGNGVRVRATYFL